VATKRLHEFGLKLSDYPNVLSALGTSQLARIIQVQGEPANESSRQATFEELADLPGAHRLPDAQGDYVGSHVAPVVPVSHP